MESCEKVSTTTLAEPLATRHCCRVNCVLVKKEVKYTPSSQLLVYDEHVSHIRITHLRVACVAR